MNKELKELVDKYNVLACPKSGVPRLTPSGKISKVDLKIKQSRPKVEEVR